MSFSLRKESFIPDKMKWLVCISIYLLLFIPKLTAQTDSVDVTFYYSATGNPAVVYLPGEFNNWGENQSGVVSDSRFAMFLNAETGKWEKTVRLRVGGPSPLPNPANGVNGAYQYKFNENGTSWVADPLNPRQNSQDNNNSYLFIQDPTIHYLLPNSVSGPVKTRKPEISAFIFPSTESRVDTGSIILTIDDSIYNHLGSDFSPETNHLSFSLPDPLSDGSHTIRLQASTTEGSTVIDSTSITVQAAFVQLLTRTNGHYLDSNIEIEGVVEDRTLLSAELFHNGISTIVALNEGRFKENVELVEGDNIFYAAVIDSEGVQKTSSSIVIHYLVYHAPEPVIEIVKDGEQLVFSAVGNDPDGDMPSFTWQSDDVINPEPLSIAEQGESFEIAVPGEKGEYYIDLTAEDPDGYTGTARSVFAVGDSGDVTIPTVDDNPGWVRNGIVYEIYLPAFTPEGTFEAAADHLPRIKSLGASIIWLMPIYENSESINEINAGYNVTDFYQVHPQLGSMTDFEAFLQEAHELGLKVILDSTPNHVAENHPWLQDIKLYGDYSPYRPMIETRILGDSRGMSQSVKYNSGDIWYVCYSNWTLANLNYQNAETVDYMKTMYRWWILEKGIDGFRMDVYWGPQNRYGTNVWWRPFREAVKRVKPDIFILGETDGTGSGSEMNYADGGGAADAAYDWNLYGEIKSTMAGGSLSALDSRVRNYSPTSDYNYYTGPHAHYFRFLENHDETRIAASYSLSRTKAGAALLMTIPGVPMIYAGQEVGETSRRGPIDWNRSGSQITSGYYQRLMHIRNTFLTFRSSQIQRISTNQNRVYAYMRPFMEQNGIAAINFSSSSVNVTLNIDTENLILKNNLLLSEQTLYLNDVLNDTVYTVDPVDLSAFTLDLEPWQSAVFVLADSIIHLKTGIHPLHTGNSQPYAFSLVQNYPNPFNMETEIFYTISAGGQVELKVFDLLGREVDTLVNQPQPAGRYSVRWHGNDQNGCPMSSGVYIIQLRTAKQAQTCKIIMIK